MTSRNKSRSVSAMGGMRPFPKEKQVPIEQMNRDELLNLQRRNETLLRSMTASSSKYVSRIQETQAKVLHRLAELEGMENIQRRLRRATISEDMPMSVDEQAKPPPKPKSRFQQVLNASLQQNQPQGKSSSGRRSQKTAVMDIDEAIALEEQHNAFEQERRARAEARREKMTMPSRQAGPGRFQTREEYEAAVWRFMSHKPTDSDMEGGDDEDDDYEDPDEDPATYFDDEEDDGIKGQNIVYPDAEDLADVIRVDTNKMRYSTFYEPRDPS